MSSVDFTEEDVVEELRELGYENVPRNKLVEFMTDLKHLMEERDERSRDGTDLSFVDSSADSSCHSDGLARYPHHTDFHWGRSKSRKTGDADASNHSSRSAFETSKAPLSENSFLYESLHGRERDQSPLRGLDTDDNETVPKRFDARDVSIASSSSTNSIVVKRKISRRNANGNRDISTEELTYVEENDDDAATLADGDDGVLDDDEESGAPNLLAPRRIVHRRHSQSESSNDSRISSASSARPVTALPSFIRPKPEIRRRFHDPVNR